MHLLTVERTKSLGLSLAYKIFQTLYILLKVFLAMCMHDTYATEHIQIRYAYVPYTVLAKEIRGVYQM